MGAHNTWREIFSSVYQRPFTGCCFYFAFLSWRHNTDYLSVSHSPLVVEGINDRGTNIFLLSLKSQGIGSFVLCRLHGRGLYLEGVGPSRNGNSLAVALEAQVEERPLIGPARKSCIPTIWWENDGGVKYSKLPAAACFTTKQVSVGARSHLSESY